MPSLESGIRNQRIVVWEFLGYTASGDPKVKEPKELKCRWEDVRREIRTAEDTVIVVDALINVDYELSEGSVVWKGALEELPDTPTAIKEVVGADITPDVKGRRFDRWYSLSRYADTLPTVVLD